MTSSNADTLLFEYYRIVIGNIMFHCIIVVVHLIVICSTLNQFVLLILDFGLEIRQEFFEDISNR